MRMISHEATLSESDLEISVTLKFSTLKDAIVPFFYQVRICLGVGYLNKPGSDIANFYSEIGPEVTFQTTPQNCKPQTRQDMMGYHLTVCATASKCFTTLLHNP